MGVSQLLNPKGIIKKPSANDLPFSPQQPVISSYYATSTLNQTVINLSFSIDTTNTDIFWLFVDGKKLDIGSSNDYIFTAIGSDLTSSQVTLEQALPAGLNIQAYKLGLKKESEFLTDNRFTQAYEYLNDGFQGFINQGEFTINATSTTGTPAAGTFYSSIVGRASMIDLSQDLKVRMGIERTMTQQVQLVQNESGPNGEQVYSTPNDVFGQIRFVGSGWSQVDSLSGQAAFTSVIGDFIEITFYGTGLNWLDQIDGGVRNQSYTVDGAGGGSLAFTGASPDPLNNRNYSMNCPHPVATGLTLGIHTIKITNNTAIGFTVYGFEVLNESSNITVTSGVGYIQGKKYVSNSQNTFSYSAPVSGTRGGRVLVYQNGDGSIGKAFQAVNASQANLASTDHTNEEVVRTYQWREFGAGRSDDFSGNIPNSSSLAFTLDDGVTTLVGTSVTPSLTGANNQSGSIAISANSGFITLTFIGTGLDLVLFDTVAGGADTYTYSIDGSSASWPNTAGNTATRIQKIVSGLPYGTHTFKLTRVSAATWSPCIKSFVVYQPKKPSVPSGTVELADYNVMATYVANASAVKDTVATGVMRKMGSVRETTFTGTWPALTLDTSATNFDSGWSANTSISASTFRYTFFGTGVEIGTFFQAVAYNITLTLNGSTNLSGTNTSWPSISTSILQSIGTGLSFTSNNPSTISGTSTNAAKGRVRISGLPLGTYTLIWTTNNTALNYIDTWDVITPIHSVKSDLYADIQNTLPVGSNALSDNRKTTPVKDIMPITKAWSQAVGVDVGATTTSTSLVPIPDMNVTIKTTGGPIDMSYSIWPTWSNVTQVNNFQMYLDGAPIGTKKQVVSGTSGGVIFCVFDRMIIPVAAGTHHIEVYWATSAGTGTLEDYRNLTVKEL
jgi:hypothetical protein